jgi:group II intron reverse transcriptase/maturase
MFLTRWLGRLAPRRLKPSAGTISPPIRRRVRRAFHRGHPAFTEEALRRAWRQVRANGGGAGVDGVDIATFEADLETQLASLGRELTQGTYRPRGVRRVLVPKRREGLRPLAIWALRDRVAQRVVYNYLQPFFEPTFLDCSYGFRPGRSVETAVTAVLKGRDQGLRWVLDTDIKDCFESIDVKLLMKMVRQRVKDKAILRLLGAWLRARILSANGQMQAAGTAQGGVLSPLLCNVYLHAFDGALTRQQLCLVRYADDLVVLHRRRQEAIATGEIASHALARLHLELNPHKTQVVHFDQGFKFLGVFFLRNEHFYL